MALRTQRPTIPRSVGNHETRIRVLERRFGVGWRFNIDNEGGWGYVIANASTDIDFGTLGMVIGETTGDGMFLFSGDPDADIASIAISPDNIALQLSGSLVVVIDRTTGKFTVSGAGGPLMEMTDGSPDLHLPVGGNVIFDLV